MTAQHGFRRGAVRRDPVRAGGRGLVAAAGIVLIGVGAVLVIRTLTVSQLVGLAIWLAAAVVLHDAVWIPVVTASARMAARLRGLRRRARRG